MAFIRSALSTADMNICNCRRMYVLSLHAFFPEIPVNIRINLNCHKVESLPDICVADCVGLPLLVFAHLFSKVTVSYARRTGVRTEYNVK